MHCTELKMRRELERARGQYPKAVHGRTVAGMPERMWSSLLCLMRRSLISRRQHDASVGSCSMSGSTSSYSASSAIPR